MKLWQHLAQLFYKAARYCDQKAGIRPIFGKRVCAGCSKAIKRHDHWRFAPDGRPRHWNCEMPQKVLPACLHKVVAKEGPDAA